MAMTLFFCFITHFIILTDGLFLVTYYVLLYALTICEKESSIYRLDKDETPGKNACCVEKGENFFYINISKKSCAITILIILFMKLVAIQFYLGQSWINYFIDPVISYNFIFF